MIHWRLPESRNGIVFLASGRYYSRAVSSRAAAGKKKRAGDGSAGPEVRMTSPGFYGRPNALCAKHLGLLAFSMPDGDLLEIGLKRPLGGALGERAIVSEGERFAAFFTFCHVQIPSWECLSGVNRPASYHRKEDRARCIPADERQTCDPIRIERGKIE
jgi:hypothetical protein